MTQMNIESRIDFDRTIDTEDRFALRRWFEQLVATFNQSNPQIWEEPLAEDVAMIGFTDAPMSGREYLEYLRGCFDAGNYIARYPELKATFQNGMYVLSGTFESFTDGILLCAGDIVIEIGKDGDESFKLKSQQLNPRFRVQK
jgi:hypothetical protein